jgi:phage gp37-like protein
MPEVIAFRTADGDGSPGGGFDATVAAPARVYDYWLGGKDNFQADRIAGEAAIEAYPAILSSARANRAFLARTVSYLAASAAWRSRRPSMLLSRAVVTSLWRRLSEHYPAPGEGRL